jgi:UDPglucose--hexose-1-phosphate uridylyltransferase
MHTTNRYLSGGGVMEGLFKKRESQSLMLDVASGFTEKSIPLEIRTDVFTGCVSRVLKFRHRLPKTAVDSEILAKSKSLCPFCPEVRDAMTPKFPATIAPEGHIRFGNATVLPNAFPYSRYCGVTLFSDDHFLGLDQFSPEILHDAFQAALTYIQRVQTADPEVKYASINWNYLMSAGGGLYHPHLQAVVSRQPTHFHDHLIRQSGEYAAKYRESYWQNLLEYEKSRAQRYLFQYGKIEFLSVFSPKGMFGEVLALFTGMTGVDQIAEQDWRGFQNGLSRILGRFSILNLNSLNMTLLLNLEAVDHCWIQARITPRMNLPPWGTSDVNYFEKGHNEIIVVFAPEDLASELKILDQCIS